MEIRQIVTCCIVAGALGASGCGGGGGGGDPVAHALPTGVFTKTIDLGDETQYFGLFSTSPYSRWQTLYRAAEVGGAGRIVSVALQYRSEAPTASTCPNTTIKLSHAAPGASVSPTFASNVSTGQGRQRTVVSNGTLSFPAGAAGTWHTISFTTPFDYDGVADLLVEFERSSPCTGEVHDDAKEGPYDAMVFSIMSGAVSGFTGAWRQDVRFAFAGGDDRVRAADSAGASATSIAPAASGRTQFLLLASDIAGAGPIAGIQFAASKPLIAATTGTYTVTLSHVPAAKTALDSATFAGNVGAQATVVAENVSVNLPVGTREWWVPLSGSFAYDGMSNLLVDVKATVTNRFAVPNRNVATGVNRILWDGDPAAPAGLLDARVIEPTLRFNGGPLRILPVAAGTNVVGHPLGGIAPGGQIQTLYRNDLLGTGGKITSVSLRLASPSVASALGNYKLYMGHTVKTKYALTDTYASNMSENALVFSGTLEVPDGLEPGDWVRIPLTSPFAYDPTKNLSILFATDVGVAGMNDVWAREDVQQFVASSVGRDDNAVGTDGTPTLLYAGILDLTLELQK